MPLFDVKTIIFTFIVLTFVLSLVLLVTRAQHDVKAVSRWTIGSALIGVGLWACITPWSHLLLGRLFGFGVICMGLATYINGIRLLRGLRAARFLPILVMTALVVVNTLLVRFGFDVRAFALANTAILAVVFAYGAHSLVGRGDNLVGHLFWLAASLFAAMVVLLLIRLFNVAFVQESLMQQFSNWASHSYLILFACICIFAVTLLLLLVLNVQTQERLESMATNDGLTGVLNRRGLQESAAKMRSICQRIHLPMSLLIVDLDFFKKVNDVYGHLVGDVVLKACAKNIKSALRGGDLVGRYGGEEFLILLPNTSEIEAAALAERVRRLVEETPVDISDVESISRSTLTAIKCTVSIGVAGSETGGYDVEGLIASADNALYTAKGNGRNQVVSHASLLQVASQTKVHY